jgi:hypothetical protein
MKLHNFQSFQKIDINDNKVLTINIYKDQTMKTLLKTNHWSIEFRNKRYFIGAQAGIVTSAQVV